MNVVLRYGNAAGTLAQFGLEPPKKRARLTAEESAVAAANNRATRIERRTMGKRQKKAIKGDVVGVKVTAVKRESGST